MITLDDYWMGRDKQFPLNLTAEIKTNAQITVTRANLILSQFKQATGDTSQRKVTSGWRPPMINAITKNAAPNSKHMTGQAVDISDPDGDLDEWCLANRTYLEGAQLWQEHPSATKGWCHLQIVPPKSGNRVFYP